MENVVGLFAKHLLILNKSDNDNLHTSYFH